MKPRTSTILERKEDNAIKPKPSPNKTNCWLLHQILGLWLVSVEYEGE